MYIRVRDGRGYNVLGDHWKLKSCNRHRNSREEAMHQNKPLRGSEVLRDGGRGVEDSRIFVID